MTHTCFEGDAAAFPQGPLWALEGEAQRLSGVTLGRVLDGSGFIHRSKTFSSTVSEGAALEIMWSGLGARWQRW